MEKCHCGARLKTDAAVCHRCGASIEEIGRTAAEQQSRQDRRDRAARRLLWALAVSVAAISVLVGAYIMLTRPVPQLVGLSETEARQALEGAGLRCGDVTYLENAVEPSQIGDVIVQRPQPGSRVWRAGPVHFSVGGAKPVAVPDLSGKTAAEARTLLEGQRLKVGDEDYREDKASPPGTVIGTSPKAGQLVQPGSKVSLVLALGPDVTVPSVVGLGFDQAQGILRDLGLEASADGRAPFGVVLEQTPSAGSKLEAGGEVRLVAMEVAPSPSTFAEIRSAQKGDIVYVLARSGDGVILDEWGDGTWRGQFVVIDAPSGTPSVVKVHFNSNLLGISAGDVVALRVDAASSDGQSLLECTFKDIWRVSGSSVLEAPQKVGSSTLTWRNLEAAVSDPTFKIEVLEAIAYDDLAACRTRCPDGTITARFVRRESSGKWDFDGEIWLDGLAMDDLTGYAELSQAEARAFFPTLQSW